MCLGYLLITARADVETTGYIEHEWIPRENFASEHLQCTQANCPRQRKRHASFSNLDPHFKTYSFLSCLVIYLFFTQTVSVTARVRQISIMINSDIFQLLLHTISKASHLTLKYLFRNHVLVTVNRTILLWPLHCCRITDDLSIRYISIYAYSVDIIIL